jgi:hypothetical protein
MCLMITADHGPAVSGAHNTIVCARAGKDLVSSLVSGLLTIVSTKNKSVYSHTRALAMTKAHDLFKFQLLLSSLRHKLEMYSLYWIQSKGYNVLL